MTEQAVPAQHASDTEPARLPADCGVAQVQALRERFAELREQEAPLMLEAAAVERVSTACLQLLLALYRERSAADRSTSLRSPSQPLVEAITWLGLASILLKPTPDETDS